MCPTQTYLLSYLGELSEIRRKGVSGMVSPKQSFRFKYLSEGIFTTKLWAY